MPGRSKIRGWEICVAAVLALCYSFSIFSDISIPDTAFFGGDTWEYQSIAVNFARGEGFRFGGLLPFDAYAFDTANPEYYDRFMEIGAAGGEPSTFRAPGYPFVLSIIYRIFGVSPRIAITIQIGWLILMCAFLPLLGRRLLGRGGFAAGLIAGLIFHKLAPNVGGEILTEALIALSLFLVLVAWVIMNRKHRTTLPSAALFGLTLAAAVLVKGSLVFLPPLFLGYIGLQVFRKRRYRPRALITGLLAFIIPLAAYSTYATQASGSFVLLSRQGPSVLLAGNNEIAVETGAWSPQWREDPNSFFNQQLARDPDRPTVLLIASFYAQDPTLLFKAIPRKLVAMFGTKTVVIVGIALLFGIAAFATCLVQRKTPQRLIVLLLLIAVAGLIGGASNPAFRALIVVFAFGPGLLLFLLGCQNRCFRRRVSALWTSPGWIAIVLVITNFVLVAIVIFGDPRFLAPARFVLALAASYLLIRMAEALELPVDLALNLEGEGPDMITTYCRHIREIAYSRVAMGLAGSAPNSARLWYWPSSDDDILLEKLDGDQIRPVRSAVQFEAHSEPEEIPELVVLNGVLSSSLDIQGILTALKNKMLRGDRLAAVLYNPHFRWAYSLAGRLGLRTEPPAATFIKHADLYSLAKASGFEVERLRPVSPFPLRLLGTGKLIDAIWRSLPVIRQLSFLQIVVFRPVAPLERTP